MKITKEQLKQLIKEELENNMIEEGMADEIIRDIIQHKPLARKLDMLKKRAKSNPLLVANLYVQLQKHLLPGVKVAELFSKLSAAEKTHEKGQQEQPSQHVTGSGE